MWFSIFQGSKLHVALYSGRLKCGPSIDSWSARLAAVCVNNCVYSVRMYFVVCVLIQ